jgi:CBS domain containing-hemolysin-like protein
LTPLPEAVDAFLKSGHSRVPVFEDTVDNILGLLYAKDLLRVWREGDQLDSLRSLLRRAYFVPEAKKVDELLTEMQRRRVHIAIVVDEYGGVAGLVTLEDIVEEILGEIRDEYDQAEELPYEALANGEYIFQGRIDLDDFNEVVASELPKEEADTLAGFIYSRLGRVPANGESLQAYNLLLIVEQVSGRRIQKVRVRNALASPTKDEKVSDVSE